MKTQWNACAYANDGNVYAIDMAGDCYKVNPRPYVLDSLPRR